MGSFSERAFARYTVQMATLLRHHLRCLMRASHQASAPRLSLKRAADDDGAAMETVEMGSPAVVRWLPKLSRG